MAAKVTVLGAGSWGTALAQHLCRVGHEVTIWGRDEAVLESIRSASINSRYFPDLKLNECIKAEPNLTAAVEGRKMIVFAVPSFSLRSVARAAHPAVSPAAILVSSAKGLEEETLHPMSEALGAEFGKNMKVAVLSGPSFAREVLLGLPTAVTMAASKLSLANEAATYFHHEYFRVYTSEDVLGVEFGGVIKNVIALAAGVVEGMGMGSNARAALITRGLMEMQRVVVALGGKPETAMGLSGLGDLLLTATGDLSRNRQVGLRLGKGEKLADILASLKQIAEGVRVTPKVVELVHRANVEAPILEETNRFLSGESKIEDSVRRLLSRAQKAEK